LHDPVPGLIEEIVRDPACAENVEHLVFTEFGPDLSDSRYDHLQRLRNVRTIYLYCTGNTDEFLANVSGMVSLESLETELADVSDEGMEHVAQCANLKKLVLYGGRPSVGNVGLAELEGHDRLESLALINTRITDTGLKSVNALVSLRSLTLFNDFANREPHLTDEALIGLRGLSSLTSLHLGGTWFTEAAVDELRRVLPHCKIATGAYVEADKPKPPTSDGGRAESPLRSSEPKTSIE
jgi:hypothetical protein